MSRSCSVATPCVALLAIALAAPVVADNHVTVIAVADRDYTRAKFPDGKPRPETYVVMPGNYFAGATVDHTLERMPFRRIVTSLAHELARREYWPAASANDADLLMVVHWGVTEPRASMHEMLGRTSLSTDISNSQDSIAAGMGGGPGAGSAADIGWELGTRSNINSLYVADVQRQQSDQNAAEADRFDAAQLLGLIPYLKRHNEALVPSVNDIAIHRSLSEERYFIIVKAYDLRKWEKGKVNRSIWTIRLNMRAPGKNFEQAMNFMSMAAVDWFGRTTDDVRIIKAKIPEGKVDMPPVVILGEAR